MTSAVTFYLYIYTRVFPVFAFLIHFIIPFEKFGQRYPVLQAHAGSFRVSVIHQTLTWTTGSLTCIRDHPYACVYTRGLGTPTTTRPNMFDSEKPTNCSCAPDGVQTSGLWISSLTLCQLSHTITHHETLHLDKKVI